MREGEPVLLNFPAASRDPDTFPNADVVQIDRENNGQVAFGAGPCTIPVLFPALQPT